MSEIPAEHLKIETWPPREKGGQHVGMGSMGVRIEHLPSGMVAICATDRSQRRNKAVAIDMLLGGLTSPSFRP